MRVIVEPPEHPISKEKTNEFIESISRHASKYDGSLITIISQTFECKDLK